MEWVSPELEPEPKMTSQRDTSPSISSEAESTSQDYCPLLDDADDRIVFTDGDETIRRYTDMTEWAKAPGNTSAAPLCKSMDFRQVLHDLILLVEWEDTDEDEAERIIEKLEVMKGLHLSLYGYGQSCVAIEGVIQMCKMMNVLDDVDALRAAVFGWLDKHDFRGMSAEQTAVSKIDLQEGFAKSTLAWKSTGRTLKLLLLRQSVMWL
jgi:hypothetical protein